MEATFRSVEPDEEKLEEALGKVVDGTLSIREATRQFSIPFGTLYNRFRGIHGYNDERLAILKSAAKCADWGFPLSLLDMRMMAKYYLDRKGRTVHPFRNNLPGLHWTYSLLQRHKKSYGQRISTNIKRARASVSRETLREFYDNFENTLRGLPSSNLFNYDESNLSDDPGKKRVIYRQGVKYPENIMNHSKSCTTIMVCGAADGTLLPPYVIYRSVHLYESWRENGPRGPPCCSLGTRYNRTISGWMDGVTFRDWFTTLFLPHAKRIKGREALIGHNLSSHLDDGVLKMCVENDIDSICFVPNSTHICQSLDVGFFRPIKGAWRETLTDFRLQNLRLSTVPKNMFSSLLKKSLNKMNTVTARVVKPNETNQIQFETSKLESAIKRNLNNSFRSTGIHPADREQVFKKLPPEQVADPTPIVKNALTVFLKEQRFGDAVLSQRKRTRLEVQPGCSISTTAYGQESDDDEDGELGIEDRPASVSSICDVGEEEANSDDFEVGQFILGTFHSQRGKKHINMFVRSWK
ncbi:hypothetical protein JTB14_022665 [Gonioctena quinquepunctata]|nr:hypothetical protein JTB14_022665 [Gonioctena quinquepunctata]